MAEATGSPPQAPPRFDRAALSDFAAAAFGRYGVPDDQARIVADGLVFADARGIGSHGIVRLPVYASRLEAGVVAADPATSVTKVASGALSVDGGNGLGLAVGTRAADEAVALAGETGIALAAVRNSNHYGAAGFYAERAVAHDTILITASNAPPNMAPWGGKTRFLGTNPLSVGVPAGTEPPVIIDMATSVVARGKIILADHEGRSIPEGWAIDPDGRPTTDARAALEGAVLPFGGAKGSAISFLLDILCGVLSGAAYGHHLRTLEDLSTQQDVGHVFIAIRPDVFMPMAAFRQRMDDIIGMLRGVPPAPGTDAVLCPGDVERARERESAETGIALSPDVVAQLETLGHQLGLAVPAPRRH
ncbi:Ldh family oxidoreductase [Fodinicurvata sp. EGI_FJ10296]|uniref:Ldh family oxidoreductase n=1 Tax=Fodinicurvata sp. EGI_FJ10296 TaxID=3231908 RepID=UPI0034537A3F